MAGWPSGAVYLRRRSRPGFCDSRERSPCAPVARRVAAWLPGPGAGVTPACAAPSPHATRPATCRGTSRSARVPGVTFHRRPGRHRPPAAVFRGGTVAVVPLTSDPVTDGVSIRLLRRLLWLRRSRCEGTRRRLIVTPDSAKLGPGKFRPPRPKGVTIPSKRLGLIASDAWTSLLRTALLSPALPPSFMHARTWVFPAHGLLVG